MGVLFDYFAADSDEQAASVIDQVGGPGSRATLREAKRKRGLLGRKGESAPATVESAFDTVSVGGVDPIVHLAVLEELPMGTPFVDVLDNPRSGHAVAERNGGELLVLTLTDELQRALATSSDQRRVEVAAPWAQTEEFGGTVTPEQVVPFLEDLAGLARRATEKAQRLYCWVSV